ncbi:conjugative transposon protein TraM [Capnocytophaga gingivalis]|uniref:conjugative transposon protein TraM n=1 Tax=Capnocytophaga gingivalis TaxID=1017 RepID=UPI003C73ED28
MKKLELPQSVIKNKEKIIVIGVSVLAVILLLVFLFKPSGEVQEQKGEAVVLSETGEASYINTSIPEFGTKKDCTNLVDKYAKIKQDSINDSRILKNDQEFFAEEGNSRLLSRSSGGNLTGRENNSYLDNSSDRLEAFMNQSSTRAQKSISSMQEEDEEEEEKPVPKKKKSKSNSTRSVYGDYSFWDNTPVQNNRSQGQRQTSNQEIEQGAALASQGVSQSQEIQNTQNNNRTNYTRGRGKKVNFEDLSPEEQKQVLREIGKPYYEENSEILAEIVTIGTVQNGESVKLMTTEDAIWNLHKIPRGTIITGVVSFSANRCNIELSSFVLKGRKIVDGNFEVYSMNGAKGLEINGFNATEEVENEGISEGLEKLGRVGRATNVVRSAISNKNKKSITISNRTPCLLRVKTRS